MRRNTSDPTNTASLGPPVRQQHERDLFGRPVCWLCREGLALAYWRGVPTRRLDGEMYRPVCRDCLCDMPGDCSASCGCHGRLRAAVVACEVCGCRLAYTEPVPEGRGTWRATLNVCSISCLNVARGGAPIQPPDPPRPRPCQWCGELFTPRRRSKAKYCSTRCRVAKHRALQQLKECDGPTARELLDRLGLGEPLEHRFADVLAEALRQMAGDRL